MTDIFVSYTSADRDWAFWIGQELEKLGHTPRIHEWEIKGSADIYAWMEQHHDAADHVLCVISDEYLLAPYSTLERNAALWQAASKRPGFVLFVVVKPCRIPTLSDHIRRCTLHGLTEDEARRRFAEFIAPPGRPPGPMPFPGIASSPPSTKAPVTFPGGPHALSNIPIAIPLHFLGRDDELKAIRAALLRGDGRVAITALHGLRGVGKTVLAAAYADRHRADYRATWWIRAQTDSTMRADLVALGVRLGWVAADENEEAALAAVLERLRHEGEGILLIYDNANNRDELRQFLPVSGAAHILVTSNAPDWGGVAASVRIKVWPKDVGADFFLVRLAKGPADRSVAKELSETLGGLPLAHEQAAAFCERLGISLADYLRRFASTPGMLLDAAKDAPADYHDRLTVSKTFALAIKEAAKLHRAAAALIEYAALLAPEPIPLFLFAEAGEKFGEPFASSIAGDGLDEAVAALRAFALIDRESIADERDATITTDCIWMHRLVREVGAARLDGKTREENQSALISAMAVVYPYDVYNDVAAWPRARRLDAVAMALLASDWNSRSRLASEVSYILDGLAAYRYSALGAYSEAKPLYERALAIAEDVSGPDHPNTAVSLNNLADLLQQQGDLIAARPLLERALAINEKVAGTEHTSTAASLNNLAELLATQGDHNAAQMLFERALAILEKVCGPEHLETAKCLNNLARSLQNRGDLAAAHPLFERALAIGEKALSAEHPATATWLNNSAALLRARGEITAALTRLERALAIFEKVLGPMHASTRHVARNTALALSELGRSKEAVALREKFRIDEKYT